MPGMLLSSPSVRQAAIDTAPGLNAQINLRSVFDKEKLILSGFCRRAIRSSQYKSPDRGRGPR